MSITSRLKPAVLLSMMVAIPATAQEYQQPDRNPMERVTAARASQEEGAGDRVFGGNEADKGEWPFQVALLASKRLDNDPKSQAQAQFCGGSLIAPDWVLTAAHCLSDGVLVTPVNQVTVLVGATNLAEGKRYKAQQFFVHEGYTENSIDNDIALIKLAAVTDAPTVKLPAGPDADSGKAMVIGWGLMENGTAPNDLMETEIDLVPNAACNEGLKGIYRNDLQRILRSWAGKLRYSEEAIVAASEAMGATMADPLTDNMMCAGTTTGARDACNGDSGGPLFVQGADGNTQVGVVSWGDGPVDSEIACGHANAYGVYTRVSRYTDWIAAKMSGGAGSGSGSGTAVKPAP